MVYAEAEIGIDYLLYSLQVIIGEVLVFVKLFSESENSLLKSADGSRTDVCSSWFDIATYEQYSVAYGLQIFLVIMYMDSINRCDGYELWNYLEYLILVVADNEEVIYKADDSEISSTHQKQEPGIEQDR